MLDFLTISTRRVKGCIEIYPKFIIKKSKDLMIRGGDFHAIWLEGRGMWSTEEDDAIYLIDKLLDDYARDNKSRFQGENIRVMNMWDADSGSIDKWHKYCQKQLRDNYNPLDENLIFSNQDTVKEDYATKRLTYPLVDEGEYESWDELLSTLYSEDERHKIEWCIGAVVSGDSKDIQKFAALYGPPGSGKSTILLIVEKLFKGYDTSFDSGSLGSASNAFALEQFRHNPLVAIDHDADLSKIEKNTTLNSLVSHERMVVNVKHKSTYVERFNVFLFIGTNKVVKITDSKSGLIRRLIDIHPSGNKIPMRRYHKIMKNIDYELGAIARHCLNVYTDNKHAYDDYKPIRMMSESNDFFNFMLDSYIIFDSEDGTTLKAAWEMYKVYCEDAAVAYPFSRRIFNIELGNFFEHFEDRHRLPNGEQVRSYYHGFKRSAFNANSVVEEKPKDIVLRNEIEFAEQPSKLDIWAADCPAQYAWETGVGAPKNKWAEVTTELKDIDTSKLHYLKVPDNHIVIDFDITNEAGEKDFELNLAEASKWPKTYAELSRSGGGIHLHYIYDGDPSQLSRIYADSIEIKVFTGNSSLRRMYTKSNGLYISSISSGLPIRRTDKVVNFETIKNERALRTIIMNNIDKKYHHATKPSMDFIFKAVNDAFESGIKYDITDMHGLIVAFASSSTNQADYCLSLIPKMEFVSTGEEIGETNTEKPIVFYDVEVFPNLFIINWKIWGKENKMNRMINPSAREVESLLNYRLVGFFNRGYDNHIIYGAILGYTLDQLFRLSQNLVTNKFKGFHEARNLSYTDIYDYAVTKQSLKKWQIELGIRHQELGLPWDEPVPEDKWIMVSEYCDNDVYATEAVWEATKTDFVAREILADITDMSVNTPTNTLTTKIVFGNERNPIINHFDLTTEFPEYKFEKEWNDITKKYDMRNMYRGIDLGFGGWNNSEVGYFEGVGLLDVASMHPNSIINMNLFGKYTERYSELVKTRLSIKHADFETPKSYFGGKIAKYLDNPDVAKQLSNALKLPINSVYGLTSARFTNPFRHPDNENNVVALRGALFMKTLYDKLTQEGYNVVHVKTDSVKIENVDQRAIDICMEMGAKYKYDFEHEATFERFILFNDSVYIGKEGTYWETKGAQFSVPYVYKKLFSKEDITISDLTEVREVKKGSIYLNFNEEIIEEELKFIGRVGGFTPVLPEYKGGDLLRSKEKPDGSTGYDSVINTKGYKWLEIADVEENHGIDAVDLEFYNKQVDEAIDAISEHTDVEMFLLQ